MAAEGDVVGGYTLVRRLGTGGMGAVWEARDERGASVALKLLHPAISSDPDARARLAREVANLNRLRGARLSRVLDAELDADIPFVVTELVEGLTLEDSVAQEGAFDPVDLHPLATGLAEAVTQVHRAGLLHRDIKPGNVMVTYDGPVLIDFGIAQLATDPRLTHTGFVTGTPGYLDPATLSGGELGSDGDWYSFAAVLLFAATGRAPFGRERMEVVLARMTAGTPDVAGLPGLVAEAFTAALAREPAERPGPRDLLTVLRRWAEGKSVEGPVSIPGVPASPSGGHEAGRNGIDAGGPADAGDATWSPPSFAPVFAPGGARKRAADGAAAPVGAAGPFGLPAPAPAEPWQRPPPPRPWLVLASGAVLLALAVLWPGVAVVVTVVAFVLLTAAGLTERRTRRRRLAAGRRRSDPWVATAWSLPMLALGLVTALVPLLVGALVAACVWWIASSLVLTDIAGSVPEWLATLVAPLALACGLGAAWWVPLAEVTRTGARASWALLAPTRGSAVVWGWCLGIVVVGVLLTDIGSGVLGPDGLALVRWWPLPDPPSLWG